MKTERSSSLPPLPPPLSECPHLQTQMQAVPSYLLCTLLLFPFHLLPSPVHTTGFSFCLFIGFLVIFTSLSSNKNNCFCGKIDQIDAAKKCRTTMVEESASAMDEGLTYRSVTQISLFLDIFGQLTKDTKLKYNLFRS